MTPDFWLDCYCYWHRASQGHCVVLCYSVALRCLVTLAPGSSASLLRAPVLYCTPVSPSGVIEERAIRAPLFALRAVRSVCAVILLRIIKVFQNPNKVARDTQGLPTVPHNDFGGLNFKGLASNYLLLMATSPYKITFSKKKS